MFRPIRGTLHPFRLNNGGDQTNDRGLMVVTIDAGEALTKLICMLRLVFVLFATASILVGLLEII